jgi:hypothetical protein
VYAARFASWAPGLSGPQDWQAWAEDRELAPARSKESPALEYTEPLFRRRLSQISRMSIQVIHDIMPIPDGAKIVFVSFRGEINQQLKINRMQIEEGDLSPAAFSQSVFNTPPALAGIALNLRSGYSALYPAEDNFAAGFAAAAASVIAAKLRGAEKEIVFVYADELCPPEYDSLCTEPKAPPIAFAVLLSSREPGIPLSQAGGKEADNCFESPFAFLRYLYLHRGHHG